MGKFKLLSFFALGGMVVPLMFQIVFWLVKKYQWNNLDLQFGIQQSMLVLWPSSLMTLPAGSIEGLYSMALLISIFVNLVLYVSVGATIWYGFKKHYLILILLAIVMTAMWWRILTL